MVSVAVLLCWVVICTCFGELNDDDDDDDPHRGLPPCRGGGAYAPMTRTISNLKESS